MSNYIYTVLEFSNSFYVDIEHEGKHIPILGEYLFFNTKEEALFNAKKTNNYEQL